MVGVAGRSKGCHTCKKRKIACSLERPQCANCLKSKRVCGGYERERLFIVNTQNSVSDRTAATKKLSPRTIRRPSSVEETPHLEIALREAPTALSGDLLALKLGDLLPRAAYRQQLFGSFLSSYVPFSQASPAGLNNWLMIALDLPTCTRALETSTMALCTARLGWMNTDVVLQRESLKLYTQGLQELQKALYEPELMYKDETLGACMALIIYELMASPENNKYAFASHHRGCGRLVQLRGPKAHTSGLGHQIFLNFRAIEILSALEDRRSTFLTNTSWTKLPWKFTPKMPFDQFLDILMAAPAISAQVDGFMSLEPCLRFLSVFEVVNKCWELDERLQKFYADLCTEHPGPLFWPETSTARYLAEIPCSGGTFTSSFRFPELGKAKILMFYWATQTMLMSGLCHLYELLGSPLMPAAIDLKSLRPLEHRADYITVARNVCRSVEYCMQEEMLGLGPQLVIAPLSMVADTLKNEPDFQCEIAWAEVIMKRIQARGMRVLKYPKQEKLQS